mmetsp:Transcript_67145/g.189896  ORF Transcript_67145/g.189896 Transcript_67145/m.189896 type:complete len:283 (-) Transcript_67145:2-850(-)
MASASAAGTAFLMTFGRALSTNSFASLRPSCVRARTSFTTKIFFAASKLTSFTLYVSFFFSSFFFSSSTGAPSPSAAAGAIAPAGGAAGDGCAKGIPPGIAGIGMAKPGIGGITAPGNITIGFGNGRRPGIGELSPSRSFSWHSSQSSAASNRFRDMISSTSRLIFSAFILAALMITAFSGSSSSITSNLLKTSNLGVSLNARQLLKRALERIGQPSAVNLATAAPGILHTADLVTKADPCLTNTRMVVVRSVVNGTWACVRRPSRVWKWAEAQGSHFEPQT